MAASDSESNGDDGEFSTSDEESPASLPSIADPDTQEREAPMRNDAASRRGDDVERIVAASVIAPRPAAVPRAAKPPPAKPSPRPAAACEAAVFHMDEIVTCTGRSKATRGCSAMVVKALTNHCMVRYIDGELRGEEKRVANSSLQLLAPAPAAATGSSGGAAPAAAGSTDSEF